MRNERFWNVIGVLAIALVIGYGMPALAQEETADPEQEEAIQQAMERSFEEEITVTGSLIPRADLAALSPVTVMEIDNELTYTGMTRIEDLVVQLPQVFAGQNASIANGASGTATIDLRYLGTNRTLVLINGRRLAPGDASSVYAPDINVIPAALVKRVDVLTGGASTVYGSDAVAGVVNFIMDTSFEGFRGGYQYSFYQHDNDNKLAQQINEERGFDVPTGNATDGDSQNAFFAVGGKFADGKGHAMAYITYRKNEEILKGYRDYVNCSVSAGSNGPECGGSSTTPQGRFIAYNADGSFNGDYILHWQNDGGDGHSFRPRTGEVFNYGPYNHLLRPNEKFNIGAFAHFTVNDWFEPYVEVMAMSDYTDAQIAPSGNFGVYNAINCDNPLLSDQQRNVICGPGTGYGPTDLADVIMLRRNVEGAPRTNQLGHDNLRLVAGIRGDISDAWSYDLYLLHAQNNSQDSYINDLSVERIGNALDIVTDPDTGEPVCRSGSADGCVPWNIFQEGAVTQEAIDYISTIAVMYGKTKTQVVNLTFTGDMEDYGLRLGSASEGLGVAFGAEYRYQYLENFPDEVYQTADAAGFGGATPKVRGDFNVRELFAEVAIPLIQDAPLFEDLSLELGYRYSDYSTSGGFDTYKGLINWAMSDTFRIRGGYNRAVRAANIWELFRPQGFGLGGSRDICAGANPAATLEQCQRTGVTPAQYGSILANPADQYNTLFGGNPELTPEVADTLTAGLVITPQGALSGMSIVFDYYNIEIDEAIGSLGFDDIVQQCATTGDPALCGLIFRDRFGSLWNNPSVATGAYVLTTNQNIGAFEAEGVDFNFSYMFGLGDAGFLPIELVGTYTLKNVFTNPLVSYDCVGYFGFQCGQANPEWRHRLRATWESNFGLNLSLAWRYFGDVTNDDGSPDSDLGNAADQEFWAINGIDEIDAFNWFDIAASYLMKNGIRFTVGVNNILDEEPPLAPTFNDFNLYETYDPWGRYIFAGIEFSL